MPADDSPSRRDVLRALAALPLAGSAPAVRAPMPRLPFRDRTRFAPGRRIGNGLDARLSFDLARLADEEPAAEGPLVTNRDFYLRTEAPEAVRRRGAGTNEWSVHVTAGQDISGHLLDFGGAETDYPIAVLRERARPRGRHLLECAGNGELHHFGLMGVAELSGVLLADLFAEALGDVSADALVLIDGNDEHPPSTSSVPGASWIFTVRQLEQAGAFLATGMNGEPLPLDHGGPVRLVVPGWYGCTSIKWVERIRGVEPDAPATSQMREFASRTHQVGVPELARDYAPAEIDFAALPVLVEGPDHQGAYRITGISWGDPADVETLLIRIAPSSAAVSAPSPSWTPVTDFRVHDRSSWALWTHTFTPSSRGEHEIALRAGEAAVRTRRLDRRFYARRVLL